MGTLSVVATPIGNLEDITLRALRTLKECDVILCEDTRVTSKLLARYEISKPLMRADEKMQAAVATKVIAQLEEGKRVVMVTDAGTPCVSDPGWKIVAKVRESGHIVEAIPGPSALTAFLSIAGVSAEEFVFVGFLPHKKGRQTMLKEIGGSVRPVVAYESPHRIVKFMKELEMHAPSVRVVIGRELTKMFEEVISGTPSELASMLEKEKKERGEFVVLVRP